MKVIISTEVADGERQSITDTANRLDHINSIPHPKGGVEIDALYVDRVDADFVVTVTGRHNGAVIAFTYAYWNVLLPLHLARKAVAALVQRNKKH